MNTTTCALIEVPPAQIIAENAIVDCITSSTGLTDKEIDFILDLVAVKTFKKGTHLLSEGDISTACFHTFKGCVRQYYLKDGEEKTTFFYTEDQSITASSTSKERMPSSYYLECLEDTTMYVMTHEREMELYKRFPVFESMCRVETERRMRDYQQMLANYIMSTPEERYLHVLHHRSELLHRVPQYQLASYLGIKPESLSRIRRRILERC